MFIMKSAPVKMFSNRTHKDVRQAIDVHRLYVPLLQLTDKVRRRSRTRDDSVDGLLQASRQRRVNETDLHRAIRCFSIDDHALLPLEKLATERNDRTKLYLDRRGAAIVRHARIDEVVPNVRIRHGSETDLPFKKRDVAVQGETLDKLADSKI